jgi:hypothetical protein
LTIQELARRVDQIAVKGLVFRICHGSKPSSKSEARNPKQIPMTQTLMPGVSPF